MTLAARWPSYAYDGEDEERKHTRGERDAFLFDIATTRKITTWKKPSVLHKAIQRKQLKQKQALKWVFFSFRALTSR